MKFLKKLNKMTEYDVATRSWKNFWIAQSIRLVENTLSITGTFIIVLIVAIITNGFRY